MAEVLSWQEATAQLWTGAGSTVAVVYARNVSVTPQVMYFSYRPPAATTYTHIETDRRMNFSIGMAEAPDNKSIKAMLLNAAGGAWHCHMLTKTPGAANGSGGWYGYTGTILGGSFAGSEGDTEQAFSLQGWFEAWSAY